MLSYLLDFWSCFNHQQYICEVKVWRKVSRLLFYVVYVEDQFIWDFILTEERCMGFKRLQIQVEIVPRMRGTMILSLAIKLYIDLPFDDCQKTKLQNWRSHEDEAS